MALSSPPPDAEHLALAALTWLAEDAGPAEDGGTSPEASADVPASDPASASPDDLVPDDVA